MTERLSLDQVNQLGRVSLPEAANGTPAAPRTALLNQFNQGASLGFWDEIGSALRATLSPYVPPAIASGAEGENWSDRYARNLAAARGQNQQFERVNPVTAGLAQLAGGIGGSLMLPGMNVVRAAGRAPAVMPGVVNSGLTGAVLGGAAGFGEGEGFADRAGNAVLGSGIGGALGTALPLAARAAGGLMRAGADRLGWSNPEARGQRILLNAIHNDATTPRDVLGVMTRDRGMGPIAPVDAAGENVGQLTRAVARIAGLGPRMAGEALEQRGGVNQMNRLRTDIRERVSPANLYDELESLRLTRSRAAAPLYDAAFNAPPVTSPTLQRIFDDPVSRAGVRRGLEVQRIEAAAMGQRFDPRAYAVTGFNQAGDPVIGPVPNWRTLDALKRGLDDILAEYRDPTSGRVNLDQRGRAIEMMRRSLVTELDRLNPEYAAARAAWAGPSAAMDAMRQGRALLGRDPEITANMVARMGDSEREAFRVGVARALDDVVSRSADPQDVRRVRALWGSPRVREALGAAFGDDRTMNEFGRRMDNHLRMAENNSLMNTRAGSQTTPLRETIDMLQTGGPPGPIGVALQGARHGGTAGGLAALAMERLNRPSSRVSDAMAPYLFPATQDAGVQAMLRLMAREGHDRRFAPAARQLTRGFLGGISATGGLLGN